MDNYKWASNNIGKKAIHEEYHTEILGMNNDLYTTMILEKLFIVTITELVIITQWAVYYWFTVRHSTTVR